MNTQSQILSHIKAKDVRELRNFNAAEYRSLAKIGINIDESKIRQMMTGLNQMVAMDAITQPIFPSSTGTPVQFLQSWMPGVVVVATAARKIDELIGITTVGRWEDEMIIVPTLERLGQPQPYGDYTDIPLSSWNVSFNNQNVVRFEEGLRIGVLEAARAGRMGIADVVWKREAAILALDIIRNNIGFLGYNSGLGQTYGYLNTPGLPAYVTVPNGASGSPLWSTKTFLEICRDIRGAIVQLRTQSQDTIDPETTDMTLAVATAAVDWLSTTSDFGISVRDWLRTAYPRIRVVSAPQLNAANGGANVFYLYADSVRDVSTDGGGTFLQAVPTRFKMLGVQQLPKGYIEDYSNATAGVIVRRPWAVVRRSGI